MLYKETRVHQKKFFYIHAYSLPGLKSVKPAGPAGARDLSNIYAVVL